MGEGGEVKRREQTRLVGNVLLVARPWPFSEGAIDKPVPPQPTSPRWPTGVQALFPSTGPIAPA